MLFLMCICGFIIIAIFFILPITIASSYNVTYLPFSLGSGNIIAFTEIICQHLYIKNIYSQYKPDKI